MNFGPLKLIGKNKNKLSTYVGTTQSPKLIALKKLNTD